jgi:hypothetical protein
MLTKIKTFFKERKKVIIANLVSLFVFLAGSSIVASFLDPAYLAATFFIGGLLHGKLSAPLEKLLVKKIK